MDKSPLSEFFGVSVITFWPIFVGVKWPLRPLFLKSNLPFLSKFEDFCLTRPGYTGGSPGIDGLGPEVTSGEESLLNSDASLVGGLPDI